MNTGFAFRDIKTNLAAERHEVWKIVMKVCADKLRKHREKGTKYSVIARRIKVNRSRITHILTGKYMSKKTLKQLILYEYVTVDDILLKVKRDQLRILKNIIPEWA